MSTRPLRILTPAQLATFERDGYLVLEGFFSAHAMAPALDAAERIAYGTSFTQWKEQLAHGGPPRAIADGISFHDNPGRSQFPTGERALDRLIEDERFLDVVGDLLGTDALSYINGHLFVRSGPTDRRHPAQPWEGWHFDHATGSFLPPWDHPGRFDYLGCGVLLDDCDEDAAPTTLVPGSHQQVARHAARWIREGTLIPPNAFTDVRTVPELAPRRPWTGRRGDLGISSSYLVHNAVPFRDRTRQRVWWTMSIGRAADLPYNRLTTALHPSERDATMRFLTQAAPRVRSLFGWPEPGHPYYTPATLELLALQYPGIDLRAYGAGPAAAYRRPEGWVDSPSGGLQRA